MHNPRRFPFRHQAHGVMLGEDAERRLALSTASMQLIRRVSISPRTSVRDAAAGTLAGWR